MAGNSSFNAISAIGGGRGNQGAGNNQYPAMAGGSGGGGGTTPNQTTGASAGAGVGFKNNGGDSAGGNYTNGCNGGGGGAGSVGTTCYGGDGLGFDISGTLTYYAGGGAGSWYPDHIIAGGLGGGGFSGSDYGFSTTSANGLTNTGSGGGGGGKDSWNHAGDGGSGVVIIKQLAHVDVCTSWEYSPWGDCTSSSTQSRTIGTSSPSGCIGGIPIINQACIYTAGINVIDVDGLLTPIFNILVNFISAMYVQVWPFIFALVIIAGFAFSLNKFLHRIINKHE
jgi:hypothetical protein